MKGQDTIRVLTEEQIKAIYTGPAKRHFPPEELKPLAVIARLYQEGGYEGLGLFPESAKDGEEPVAYAFFIKAPGTDALLLDYYAVMEPYRNGGTGSLFLQKMRKKYEGREAILIETEAPETARNREERAVRLKRNDFYSRNGAVFTPVRSRLFGVEYYISYIPLKGWLSAEQLCRRLYGVYRYMLGGEAYRQRAEIWTLGQDGTNLDGTGSF